MGRLRWRDGEMGRGEIEMGRGEIEIERWGEGRLRWREEGKGKEKRAGL